MILGDSVASFRNVNTHNMSHNMSYNMLHVKSRRPGLQPKIGFQKILETGTWTGEEISYNRSR